MAGFYCLPTTTHPLMLVRYSLVVLGIKCLLWLLPSLIFVHYDLHYIAFNSFGERWKILTLISNECRGVIDFSGTFLIGPSITLLPIQRVNIYLCHLWGTHLMNLVVVHHMDNASLMDNVTLVDDAVFLFFCYMMDEDKFSHLYLLQ